MVISIGHENIICRNFEDYRTCLEEMLRSVSAEIWISENGSADDVPAVGILTNGDMAVLNYFAEDGRNYVTTGDLSAKGFLPFCDGAYEVHKYQVITKTQAFQGILEFYQKRELPDGLQWDLVCE